MKFLFLLSFCLFTILIKAQIAVPDYQASTGGIGPFKIGMSRAAIEKLLNIKLKLPNSSNAKSYEMDTVMCTYKEMKLQLEFSREYYGNDTMQKQGLYSITSSYPLIKTKSGIGIGDDKLKIVKTYDQYRLVIVPVLGDDNKQNANKSTVTLYDNESIKVLIFYLDNNIITAIGTTQYYGD